MMKLQEQNNITKVMQFIENNLAQSIDVSFYASAYNLSEDVFRKLFLRLVTESPEKYQHRLRMECVVYQLLVDRSLELNIHKMVGLESYDELLFEFETYSGQSLEEYMQRAEKNFGRFYDFLCKTVEEKARLVTFSALDDVRQVGDLQINKLQLKSLEELSAEISIVEIEEKEVYFSRHIGTYKNAAKPWTRFVMLSQVGKKILDRGIHLYAANHDYPGVTPVKYLRYDACLLTSEFELGQDFPKQIIGGGKYASYFHDDLTTVDVIKQQLLTEWLPQSGHRFRYAPLLARLELDNDATSTLMPPKVRVTIAIPIS